MISNTSLPAFSAATAVRPPQNPPQKLQLVRDTQAVTSVAPTSGPPAQRPSISPPRGTLLNLSV